MIESLVLTFFTRWQRIAYALLYNEKTRFSIYYFVDYFNDFITWFVSRLLLLIKKEVIPQ